MSLFTPGNTVFETVMLRNGLSSWLTNYCKFMLEAIRATPNVG